MLYALKDDQQQIIAVSERQLTEDWLEVDLEDKELAKFLKDNPSVGSKVMQAADADFIRVLEDIIDLLIDKGIIQFTELPVPVQSKLLNRRQYREQLRGAADTTHLMDSDDKIF